MQGYTKTEEKIIEAATEIFLEKGKDGARMQEIAERACINKALLHYYFRSKENLHSEVFKKEVQNFFDGLFSAMSSEKDFEAVLRNFINNYIDRLAQRPEIVRFIIWEIQQGSGSFANLLEDIFKEHHFTKMPLVEKIEEAVSVGRIRPLDPIQLTFSIIGMCVFPFIASPILEKVFQGIQINSEAFLRKRKDEIFNMIWKGIAI
jgi:AcrR family transcriptional regulator